MRSTIARPAWLALALLLVAPAAAGHGLLRLDAVVPAECPRGEGCLETTEGQPSLHAGETVAFNAYNDDDRSHRLHVTTNASADHASRSTSEDLALASTDLLAANTSRQAGEVAIPSDAEALYVWCSVDDHEAAGEHLVLDLEGPHGGDETDETSLSPTVAAIATVLAAVLAPRRADS